MFDLPYLRGYPDSLQQHVRELLQQEALAVLLAKRYTATLHHIQTDAALYDFAQAIKRDYLKSSAPVTKIVFDPKIHVINNALGTHTQLSRVQGNKLKSKNEIRIASQLKQLPLPLLRMVIVHELAHLKQKDHNKAFYQLCEYMEPDYQRLELDLRLFLTLEHYQSSCPNLQRTNNFSQVRL